MHAYGPRKCDELDQVKDSMCESRAVCIACGDTVVDLADEVSDNPGAVRRLPVGRRRRIGCNDLAQAFDQARIARGVGWCDRPDARAGTRN